MKPVISISIFVFLLDSYLCTETADFTTTAEKERYPYIDKRGGAYKRLPGWSVWYGKRSDGLAEEIDNPEDVANESANRLTKTLDLVLSKSDGRQEENSLDAQRQSLYAHANEVSGFLRDWIDSYDGHTLTPSSEGAGENDAEIKSLDTTNSEKEESGDSKKRSKYWQAFYGKRSSFDTDGDESEMHADEKRGPAWLATYGKRAPSSESYAKRLPGWRVAYGKRDGWSNDYGKRLPGWRAMYGKRSEHEEQDTTEEADKRLAWTATYGKRVPNWNAFYGKRAMNWNALYGKRAPNWNAFYGKRAPNWNALYGKRAPNWNAFYGKRATNWNAFYGKRAPYWNAFYGKRAPNWNAFYGKRAPLWQVTYGKRSTDALLSDSSLEHWGENNDDRTEQFTEKRARNWLSYYGR